MTFLSITPDTFATLAEARAPARSVRRRTSRKAQALALVVVMAGLTVPGAVAQAKWSKLNLVVTFVEHRCRAALTV